MDEDMLTTLLREMPPGQGWQMVLAAVASVDLLASGAIMSYALATAFRTQMGSLMCLGFQVMSHMIFSLLLIMQMLVDLLPRLELYGERCRSDVTEEYLLRVQRRRDFVRERAFSFVMGFVLFGLSIFLIVSASFRFRDWDTWYKGYEHWDKNLAVTTSTLAFWGAGLYVPQAVLHGFTARRLKRWLLWNGLFMSLVSAACLSVVGVAASIEQEWSWKAEPVASLAISVVILGEGIRLLCHTRSNVEARVEEDSLI